MSDWRRTVKILSGPSRKPGGRRWRATKKRGDDARTRIASEPRNTSSRLEDEDRNLKNVVAHLTTNARFRGLSSQTVQPMTIGLRERRCRKLHISALEKYLSYSDGTTAVLRETRSKGVLMNRRVILMTEWLCYCNSRMRDSDLRPGQPLLPKKCHA
jgi:hypothetical protein